ncbi:MAG: hypothetical protein RJA25_2468 [Bacteroidota bacterium]|jgi:hypothetical protein
MKNEIILYQPDNQPDIHIEVRIEEETVWLTQAQIGELFSATKQNISLHINNIFKEGELEKISVVKYSLTTATDGKRYNTALYNLDVIISVGYRIKSKQGTQFRIWANKILKEYLLKGYAINHRIEQVEKKILQHDQQFELLIKTALPPTQGIFYDGQISDAWIFVSDLIKTAKKSIILIDNYVDETVLTLLSKRKKKVKAIIHTQKITKQFKLDIEKHNSQYDEIEGYEFLKSHDRFLIIDEQTVYHIGASLKDLGKKWFAFSKMIIDVKDMIKQLQ